MSHFVDLVDEDLIDPTAFNKRFQSLSDALDAMRRGDLEQTQPDIDSFIDASHNHQNAAGGGQLTVAALDSEAATVNQVPVADGDGGVVWQDPITGFRNLSDTPSSYGGGARGLLMVDADEEVLEFAVLEVASHVLNEVNHYTTSSTVFVDVDATDLALTINTHGGDVLVGITASTFNESTSIVYFDVDLDGARVGGDDGLVERQFTGVGIAPLGFIHRITGLAAGSHTVKLQWKVAGSTVGCMRGT